MAVPASGALDVLGTSRRKLLHVVMSEESGGGRQLALASVGCEDNPRVFVSAPAGAFSGSQPLDIRGRKGNAYGTLEPSGRNGGAVLVHGRQQVMTIEVGTSGDMQMTATIPDGRVIATAGRSSTASGMPDAKGDTWKLQVMPGADAILIASCMLAMILLNPWKGR